MTRELYFRSDLPHLWDAIKELIDDNKRSFSRLSADEKNQVFAALVLDMPGEYSDLFFDPKNMYDVTSMLALYIKGEHGIKTLRTSLTHALKANYGAMIDQLFEQIADERDQADRRHLAATYGRFNPFNEETYLDGIERAKAMNAAGRL